MWKESPVKLRCNEGICQDVEMKYYYGKFKTITKQRDKVVYAGGTRSDRPIDGTRKSPKLSLNQAEIDCINAICGKEMESYGYSLISKTEDLNN